MYKNKPFELVVSYFEASRTSYLTLAAMIGCNIISCRRRVVGNIRTRVYNKEPWTRLDLQLVDGAGSEKPLN